MGRLQLSPLNRRRWNNFRGNSRGYWSLWIILALFATVPAVILTTAWGGAVAELLPLMAGQAAIVGVGAGLAALAKTILEVVSP